MKPLLFLVACLLSLPGLAQDIISGKTGVQPGSMETYVVNWPGWSGSQELHSIVTWNVVHGTLVTYDKHSATVIWDSLPEGPGDLFGSIDVYEDIGGQFGGLAVTVLNSTTSEPEFCGGVLGPAAVAVDFGSGGIPGPPLPVGTTTYDYTASCAVSPNQYTRTNNSMACRALWHNIPQDHTPNDTNGYFLMVDADDRPGEFYRTEVSGLMPAFRYEFSAWVGNLLNSPGPEEPRVRFEIHGPAGLIGSSGDIIVPYTPVFQWQRVGFMFDIPAGVSSVSVVLVNRNMDKNGNDLVLDDISFSPCFPPVIASFQNGVVVDKAHTCDSGSVNLYSWWPSTIPFTTPAYQWQKSVNGGADWGNIPGATSPAAPHSEATPGIYQYRLLSYESSNPAQYVVSNPLTYFVQRMVVNPKIHRVYSCNGATAYETLVPSYFMEFADPTVSLQYSFNWSPSTYLDHPTWRTPSITLPSPGPAPPPNGPPAPPALYTYDLTVTNLNFSCAASNTQTVAHHNPRKVAIPNSFTPNGDGLNDLFRPRNLEDYPGSKFWIYNRWGQEIFYSEGPTLLDYSWDGTLGGIPQGSGTFPWRVALTRCFGNISNGSTHDNSPHGTVNLLR